MTMNKLKQKAKEIFSDYKYHVVFSGGKAIARYNVMVGVSFANGHYEKIFDSKTEAKYFLKEKNLEHAKIILEHEKENSWREEKSL